MTREQGERLWHAALATEAVGGSEAGDVERDRNPHFLAALMMVFPGSRYQNLNYRDITYDSGCHSVKGDEHRVKVAAFLREWADAIDGGDAK